FFFFSKVPGTEWLLGIELDKSVGLATMSSLMRQLIITAVIITGLVAVLVAWLVGFLFRDLNRVSSALAEIAEGDADLTQRIEPRYQDEV
ncbi:hypothetical protein, partial [Bacillus cereus group sp. BC329]|uniref:hypothetical protein n=1 Tax=Bacillus cereus group sp. BC329 TaxID=3445307 RepID=UPI003F69EC56